VFFSEHSVLSKEVLVINYGDLLISVTVKVQLNATSQRGMWSQPSLTVIFLWFKHCADVYNHYQSTVKAETHSKRKNTLTYIYHNTRLKRYYFYHENNTLCNV